MTIKHHPAESMLLAYAGGTLDAGTHVALATHLFSCRECRNFVARMEDVGGDLLDAVPTAAMHAGAFGKLAALLDEPAPARSGPPPPTDALSHVAGLPRYVRGLAAEKWRWVAPGLHIQSLMPPAASAARVFLLRARAGMRMVPHGHSGVELTCVLKGSFSHDGQLYAVGDFDCGDGEGDHAIAIGDESECLCLVALTGELQLRGLAGRLFQPFIAI